MAGDGDKLSNLSARVSIVERRLGTLESTIDSVVQEIKRLSFNSMIEA